MTAFQTNGKKQACFIALLGNAGWLAVVYDDCRPTLYPLSKRCRKAMLDTGLVWSGDESAWRNRMRGRQSLPDSCHPHHEVLLQGHGSSPWPSRFAVSHDFTADKQSGQSR